MESARSEAHGRAPGPKARHDVPLTILSIAYPFARVSRDTAGGAEQVLAAMDAAIVAAGHRSIVVGREDSRVAGELVPIARHEGELDAAAVARAHASVAAATRAVLDREHVDVVHLHGIDFDRYMPPPGPPALATLHLPPSWYPRAALAPARPDTTLSCVSYAQRASMPGWAAPAEVIENGVPTGLLRFRERKAGYCLLLARMCPEKGVHEALDAAERAGVPLVVAGDVSAWGPHRRYFDEQVAPRLRPPHRFLGPVGFARKRPLLAAARAVLVPSRVAETSSLVAMEALASGTPVVAYATGALPSAVEDGVTGFIVEDARAMADAIGRAPSLDPRACRLAAEERFSIERMTTGYLDLYVRLARRPRSTPSVRMDISEARGREALEALAPEWRAIASRCPAATPFQRPEWLLAYARAFCGEGSGASAWALVARRGGELVGLAPLCTRGAGCERRTTLLGDGVSDYLDVLASPELLAPATRALLGAIEEVCADHEVFLDALREGSPLLAIDIGARDVTVLERGPSPVLRLASGLDPLPRAMRENLRYYRRRAERLGCVAHDVLDGGAARDGIEQLFALHRARWRTRGEDGALASADVEAFHRDGVPALASVGAAEIHRLAIGPDPAAVALVLRDRWSAYYYIGGLDPRFEAASPGTLLLGALVERARGEGLGEVDLLRGQEAYKYRFGAVDRPTRALRIAPRAPVRAARS